MAEGGVADVFLTVTSHLDAGMLRFTCTPTTRMAELMAAYRRCAEAHGTDRRTLSSARFLYFDKVITPEVTAAELELFDGDQIVLVERAHETEEEYEGRWGHLRARGIRLPDYWGHTPWHNSPKSAARLIELLARNHRDRGWVQTILTRGGVHSRHFLIHARVIEHAWYARRARHIERLKAALREHLARAKAAGPPLVTPFSQGPALVAAFGTDVGRAIQEQVAVVLIQGRARARIELRRREGDKIHLKVVTQDGAGACQGA